MGQKLLSYSDELEHQKMDSTPKQPYPSPTSEDSMCIFYS